MQLRHRQLFTAVRTEGAILPADLLRRINDRDEKLGGLTPESYHLPASVKLNEAINHSWTRAQAAWSGFRAAREKLPPGEAATTVTRERWLLPLFQELGYGRLVAARSAIEIEGKSYAVSHVWQQSAPIHLVGAGVTLDARTKGVAGAAGMSPHGLTQELLNRSEQFLWGFVSNGLRLRILRDNVSLTRQSFVEFDLEAMMQGELYPDFAMLWLLCHESRVLAERTDAQPVAQLVECWLEKWSKAAEEEGTRALKELRRGVEEAIKALGRGFIAHPANQTLRRDLAAGELDKQDYYRQLLRLVYRMLFLFVAEDRDLLLDPRAGDAARQRYTRFYSLARLRRLSERRLGTKHADLYHGLRLVMDKLSNGGCAELALAPLGSFLFSREAIGPLHACEIANADLLAAVRSLAFLTDQHGRRQVDYKHLRSEELGSIYEALLELHPEIDAEARQFDLQTAGGNERKTTGSYYTPDSLVQCLLDSALDPVVNEAVKGAGERETAEQAILRLKVVDPACGSGHFLIAASHRLAKRLAAIRTGDDEPAPEALRTALRDVIGHCIYGVDINPMAVELCKVSLWMESLEPGKPLSFLEHRIQCGNSLIGATPALMAKGIPDEAFKRIEGDDKAICAEYKKRNKKERVGHRSLPFEPWERLGNLAASIFELDAIGDADIEGIRRKHQRYEDLVRSSGYLYGRFLADAWCAAFVWKKTREFPYPITEDVFREIEKNPYRHATGHDGGWLECEVKRLAAQYQFFHWHLAFPDVFRVLCNGADVENKQAGWSGGFDVVLGNPPWDQKQFREQEFFYAKRPDFAQAITGEARKLMIQSLEEEDPSLHSEYRDAHRQADAIRHFVQSSGKAPLTARGRMNDFALFAETNKLIVRPVGRVGCILPSGVATDDTCKFFFQNLISSNSLISLFDFENREGLFPEVDSRAKFCLMTFSGQGKMEVSDGEFVFFAHAVSDLFEPDRRFTLSAKEIAQLNPNTQTCPIFRHRRDASLTKSIYTSVPVLICEGLENGNPWEITTKPGLFNMTGDSKLFRTKKQLEAKGGTLKGNHFIVEEGVYLPLYEGKMYAHYDHRAAHVVLSESAQLRPGQPDYLSGEEHLSPDVYPLPRYWVSACHVEKGLQGQWSRKWILGWKEVTSSTNERTLIPGIFPRVGIGHKVPIFLPSQENELLAISLLSCLSSLVCDFVARQKLGGTSLTPFTFKQLAVFGPSKFRELCQWSLSENLHQWLVPRVLELAYTAYDLQGFAEDCGYTGEPFRWDEDRRFLLRCELDAAYFHLYGIAREDVDYILDTFPIVRRKDETAHGEYRTKRVILEIYDEMARAMASGQPYQTRLDPPPAFGWTPPELFQEEVVAKPVAETAGIIDEEQSDLFAWQAENSQQRLKFDDTE